MQSEAGYDVCMYGARCVWVYGASSAGARLGSSVIKGSCLGSPCGLLARIRPQFSVNIGKDGWRALAGPAHETSVGASRAGGGAMTKTGGQAGAVGSRGERMDGVSGDGGEHGRMGAWARMGWATTGAGGGAGPVLGGFVRRRRGGESAKVGAGLAHPTKRRRRRAAPARASQQRAARPAPSTQQPWAKAKAKAKHSLSLLLPARRKATSIHAAALLPHSSDSAYDVSCSTRTARVPWPSRPRP